VSTNLDAAPWAIDVAADDVADSRSAACWSVEGHGWKQILPDLPDEMIALLATPVVVSAEAFNAPRADKVVPRQAAPDRAPRFPAPRSRAPRFRAPLPPRRRRGRHRRPATVAG
jgi:hypothetical protein